MRKKQLGQNFLTDATVVKNLVNTANLTKDDVVLEIGAGEGIVTRALVKQVKHVYAVEFDSNLIPLLHSTTKPFNHLTIVNEDVLKVLSDVGAVRDDWKVTAFVGSIPYQITSPLIHQIVAYYQIPTTILIQKEVAERITAKPPHATYLSNLVAYWGEAKSVETVPNTAFDPIPKVDGAIISFIPHITQPIDVIKFSKFLHKGFASPRKMLNKIFNKELLLGCEIDHTRRAETLTLAEWKKLYDASLPN